MVKLIFLILFAFSAPTNAVGEKDRIYQFGFENGASVFVEIHSCCPGQDDVYYLQGKDPKSLKHLARGRVSLTPGKNPHIKGWRESNLRDYAPIEIVEANGTRQTLIIQNSGQYVNIPGIE